MSRAQVGGARRKSLMPPTSSNLTLSGSTPPIYPKYSAPRRRQVPSPAPRPSSSACAPAPRSPAVPATTLPVRWRSVCARRSGHVPGHVGDGLRPSARPSADSTGTVAGFASADGRYLPLACTLNATVAVDQVSEWLGLGREDVASADEVVFLPWLGGERTPNAPAPRHLDRRQVLDRQAVHPAGRL